MEKEWVSKMGTFVGTLLCILILPVVVINCTLLFKSHINRERVPNIAGTFPMVVLTDSMYPEFQAGDLIFCHTKSGRCIPQADPGAGKRSGLYADVKRNDGLCCVPDPSVCYV